VEAAFGVDDNAMDSSCNRKGRADFLLPLQVEKRSQYGPDMPVVRTSAWLAAPRPRRFFLLVKVSQRVQFPGTLMAMRLGLAFRARTVQAAYRYFFDRRHSESETTLKIRSNQSVL